MMRIILLGPPGAGKGTQAESIKARCHIAHISTGDILRSNVKEASELGKTAKAYMDAGKLVPDELIIAMMESRLREPDVKNGFLLDGFPRTRRQAEALDELLEKLELELDAVVKLEAGDDVVIQRLTSRRVCKQCGEIYNVVTKRPKVEGVCDKCGGEVIQRSDDSEAIIRGRLSVYHEQTAPLIEYYRSRGILLTADATGPKDSVMKLFADCCGCK